MNAPNFSFRQRRNTSLPDAPRRVGRLRLGDILIRDGALRPDQVADMLKIQTRQAAPLGEIITAQGLLSRNAVTRALARMAATSTVDLDRDPPDPRLASRLSVSECLTHDVIPWQIQGGAHILAAANPARAATILRCLPEDLQPARLVQADTHALHRAIASVYGKELACMAETRAPAAQSCRNWSGGRMAMLAACLGVIAAVMVVLAPTLLGAAIFWVAVGTLLLNTALKAACVLIAMRKPPPNPAEFRHTQPPPPGKLPKVSILVPLFKEANIAASLIERLGKLDYPAPLLELCLVVEADDTVTRRAVRAARLPPSMKVITVPTGQLKTKPRAMNYALDFTSGDIIGVYDAEDAPDRDQLVKVVRRFAKSDAKLACLQGILSFYNPRAGWLARCFAFEYAGWFRVMLPGLQALGFAIPLGGTTLFFRREALVKLGGWDAHNVTEDADLGIRLARHGYRCEMINTVTGEEANNRFWPWVRQRSRWLKGYAMTWWVHARHPVQLWRDLGTWKLLGFHLLFLGTLLAFCLAPILWWNVAYFASGGWLPPVAGLPAGQVATLSMVFMACEAVTFALFFIAGRQLEYRPALAWIITLPAYFTLGTLAAYKGVAEMIRKPFFWDKTEHGLSPAEVALQVGGRVDFEAGLERDGQMVLQRAGGGLRIAGLDRLDDGKMLVKRH